MLILAINKQKLEGLLNRHKDDIGGDLYKQVADVIAALGVIIAAITIGESSTSILRIIKWIVCILSISYGIWSMVRLIRTNVTKFDYKRLEREIMELDETKHHHSLIAIKDTFNDHPNRFLLYFDKRWECRLLLNYKTIDDESENEKNIINRLSQELKIAPEKINLIKKRQEIYSKKSASHQNQLRIYDHILYVANLSLFPEMIREKNFDIQEKAFTWMTLQEMKQDKDIQEKNSDVLDMLEKECI